MSDRRLPVPSAPADRTGSSASAQPARTAGTALGAQGVAVVLALALVVKGLELLMVATHGSGWQAALSRFDATWYANILRHGYPWPVHGPSQLAFFPLFPLAGRLLFLLGLAPADALLAVAWASTLVAAVLLAAFGARVAGRRAGLWTALLWLLAPHSVVQVMGYSEGLFTALAAGCLLALESGRRWGAAILCTLAGLTRPTGSALDLAVVLALLLQPPSGRATGRRWWPTRLAQAGLAVLGTVSYLVFVGVRTGHVDGYLRVQRAWNSPVGDPWQTVEMAWKVLTTPDPGSPNGEQAWTVMACLVLLLALVTTTVVVRTWRARWPATLYAVLGVLLVFSQGGYFNSKARLLLPLFPLLVPLAALLARLPRWAQLLLALAVAYPACH